MKLIKNIFNLNLEYAVCRKINRSSNTISYDSNSSFNYKLVAYNFCLRRAFKVCSSDHLYIELNTVKDIATDNEFHLAILRDNSVSRSPKPIEKGKPKYILKNPVHLSI